MTESEWLEIVKKVRTIHKWRSFCVEKDEFNTYYGALKEYDAKYVSEATDRIIKNWPWELMVATFTERIKVVMEDEQYRASREQAEKNRVGDVKKKLTPANDHGWFRFTRWMLDNKKKWPKRPDHSIDRGGVEKLKAKFEKEYPNWQPRKRRSVKSKGMTRIGESLGDAMGNL